MALRVLLRDGGPAGSSEAAPELSLAFDTPRLVIGRGDGCDVRLPDPSVSHRHASIRQRGAVRQVRQVVRHPRAALDLPGPRPPQRLVAAQHSLQVAGRRAGQQFGQRDRVLDGGVRALGALSSWTAMRMIRKIL